MELFLYIWQLLIEGFNFFLPVFIFNVGIYLLIDYFGKKNDIPLDNGSGLIGNSRSIITIPFAIIIGLIVGIMQERIIESLYLCVGASFGTIVNSFVKRKLNIKPGGNFFPFDQIDFILGASLMYISRFALSLDVFFSGIFIGFILHLVVNKNGKMVWEKIISKD